MLQTPDQLPSVPSRDVESVPFGHLRIAFDDRLLRPRPWTAEQSRWAAELVALAPEGPVLELCAGAGHIGLLCTALQSRPLVAVDVNPVACGYARLNADANGLGDLVEVRRGPVDAVLEAGERFAVVIADPPWVRRAEVQRFPEDPLLAIDGGDDGLDLAWLCLEVTAGHLADGGSAVLQLGTPAQVDAVRARLAAEPAMGLRVGEQRSFGDRGVLVRVDRQPG
jgi:release factor glutamine methyltransferase